MKQEEKAKVMRLLKELSISIEKTKEDIKNMISIAGLKKRSKTEVESDGAEGVIISFFFRFRKICWTLRWSCSLSSTREDLSWRRSSRKSTV